MQPLPPTRPQQSFGEYLCGTVHQAVHAAIDEVLAEHVKTCDRLLDVGCWDGIRTVELRSACGAQQLCGIEVVESQAQVAERRGIAVERCNLETAEFPWDDNFFDVVVCNQVLEHLKDIFGVVDEIARVLKPGGVFVASVPNLASLHSRIMLWLGLQPSMIRVFGPHVRSFTYGEFLQFLSRGGTFQLVKGRGVGFYPLPATGLGNFIGRLWPAGSHTPVLVLRRMEGRRFSWRQAYYDAGHQTTM